MDSSLEGPFDDFLHCCRSRAESSSEPNILSMLANWPRSRATEPILRDAVFDRVLQSHVVRARLNFGIVCPTFCQSASNLHTLPARETQTLPHTNSLARTRSLTQKLALDKILSLLHLRVSPGVSMVACWVQTVTMGTSAGL